MRLLLTGADGFIGKNLRVALGERGIETLAVVRGSSEESLREALHCADAVLHLAGVNRSADPEDFATGNIEFTSRLSKMLEEAERQIPIVFASSIQAGRDTPYGKSKLAAERLLEQLAERTATPVAIFRLHNVFGKWCKPNYNSAVATFCYNVARGAPLRIDDEAAEVSLVYVDDVVNAMLACCNSPPPGFAHVEVAPLYRVTVGDLAETIRRFRSDRENLDIGAVGAGLLRALYSTYVSYLPPESFSYRIASHSDHRGVFSEMLRTRDSGQFSYFTAHPGVTRGGHYHHTKTEKFLVIQGAARFRFRNIVTGEIHELRTDGTKPEIVETIPGWAHDICNVGETELLALLWANEVFDPSRPDTFVAQVTP